jgi:endoplasmic reticulum-Golgi intermediate compartment protein 3
VDHLYVNTSRASDLYVSFDISFPNIPCNLLSVDVVDDIGGVVKTNNHDIYKHRLTPTGETEGVPNQHILGNTIKSEDMILQKHTEPGAEPLSSEEILKQVKCGNCYGAGYANECCNTCDDVKRVYGRMGWRFKKYEVDQCHREILRQSLLEEHSDTGGCQIYGRMELNKASGHFHFAPHNGIANKDTPGKGILNLMELLSFTFDQFNITHTVNSLSFGNHFPGLTSPLDGQFRKLGDTHGMYQYYVKVVPTRYQFADGREVQSNQYSVTEHMRHLAPGSGRGIPGLYFYYQVSPLHAVFEEKRPSVFRFFTSACAIIGGCFTVMGIVDLILNGCLQLFGKSEL